MRPAKGGDGPQGFTPRMAGRVLRGSGRVMARIWEGYGVVSVSESVSESVCESCANVKKCNFFAKKCKNICICQKKAVPLYRISIVGSTTNKINEELWKK